MHRHPKLLSGAPPGRHFCQIHDDPAALTDAVIAYAKFGLLAGNAVVVAAEAKRLKAVVDALAAAYIDVEHSVDSGQLTLLDAEVLLDRVMAGARPDAAAFTRIVGGVLDGVAARGFTHTRVYGELVNLLWHQGNSDASIELEELWNELATSHRFALYCGYEMGGLDEAAYEGPLAEIARCHSDLLETDSDQRLQAAIDAAATDVLGLPLSAALCYFGKDQHEAEHRLPAGRRTILWLRRNMPAATGKVLARARFHYR